MLFKDRPAVPDISVARAALEQGSSFQIQFGSRVENQLDIFEMRDGELVLKKTVSSAKYLEKLNGLCREFGPRLEVRFYGHYGDLFDGEILLHLPDVANLTLNCLDEARNLHTLSKLEQLQSLSLGVYELTDKDITEHIPLQKLTWLCLEETATKAVNLAPLAKANALRTLKLYGHKKNIQTLSALTNLEEFVFNPARGMALDFINAMTGLKALKLVLGGLDDFDQISLPQLDQLAVTRVRGLKSLGDLSRFPKLRQLMVQDQIQISSVEFSNGSKNLEDILIDNCKTLSSLIGLETLPALRSLSLGVTDLKLQELSLPKSLTHMSVHVGTTKGNKAAKTHIRNLGLLPETNPDMSFFYK